MLRKHSSLIKYLAVCVDIFIIELNWFIWYKITSSHDLGFISSPVTGKYNSWKTGTVLAVVWIVMVSASKFYRSKRVYTIFSEWWDITKNLFSVTIVFIFFSSVFLDVHLLSRGAFAGFYVTSLLVLMIERAIVRFSLRTVRSHGLNYRNVLIIGAGNLGMRVAEKIKADPWLGYRVIGYLDDHKTELIDDKYPILGTVDDLKRISREHKVDKIIVTLPMRAYKKLESILELLNETFIDCSVVPDLYHFQLLNSGIHDLDGLPLIDVMASPVEGTDALLKRIADVTLSAIIILITSPLLLLISIAIKLNSSGPVLFTQKRHGESGRVFDLYKFRSMRLHNGNGTFGPVQATRNDTRVTVVGRILRRTSLDELPQFFNVIKGDMSIVGPRPHAVEHDDYYKEKIAPYLHRFRILPGITGWAQVNGWRGETPEISQMEKRVEFDIEYIQNWDIWLDFKIILMTLYKGFVARKAY